MKGRISNSLRPIVAKRAGYRCEYCRIPEYDNLVLFHIEHIISLKHGGTTDLGNLAYACPCCNFYKGSDLGTIIDDEDVLIRFFHPRKDEWSTHFYSLEEKIFALTKEAEATIKIFKLNRPDRIELRQLLSE